MWSQAAGSAYLRYKVRYRVRFCGELVGDSQSVLDFDPAIDAQLPANGGQATGRC